MHKNKLKWVAVIVIVTVFIAVQIAADLKCFKGVIDLKKIPGRDKAAHFVLMGLFAAALNFCFNSCPASFTCLFVFYAFRNPQSAFRV